MPTIKLQSSDGEVFPVDVEIARQSVTIKTMLEDLGMEEDEDEVVPLPNVNAAILKKVIQWATYHKDDPPPPEDDENKEKRTDDISSWDSDFLKVDQGTLFELILAANYLDIKVIITFDINCKEKLEEKESKFSCKLWFLLILSSYSMTQNEQNISWHEISQRRYAISHKHTYDFLFQGLLDVTCKTVANMIKGKTPEEIRKTFNIKNDFTPSEEEQVRKENEWCEEK